MKGWKCCFDLMLEIVHVYHSMTSNRLWKKRGKNPKRYSRQQNSRKDDLAVMVSPLDSGDWFTPGVNDVKMSMEEEGEDAKEADVCNEIENKMNIGKCPFVWFLILPYY